MSANGGSFRSYIATLIRNNLVVQSDGLVWINPELLRSATDTNADDLLVDHTAPYRVSRRPHDLCGTIRLPDGLDR
jgi:hypothetical protein